MILEVTNPKYIQRPQVPARIRFYEPRGAISSPLDNFSSQGSRSMAKWFKTVEKGVGKIQTENFRDRLPNEKPSREPEPRDKPLGASLRIRDEAPDASLWLIIDIHTGVVFARVRGSLTWVVNQVRLAAHQLGGKETDLYYRRAD